MKIGVLTNLRAGRNDARTHRVLRELAKHPEVLRRETSTTQAVPDAVAEFAEEGVEVLVLNGGDGTLQTALTEILNAPEPSWQPMLVPTRCGRTNMVALDLGTQRNPVRSIRSVLEAARTGRIHERVIERSAIGLDTGSEERRWGMFLGAGTLPRAIEMTHKAFPEGRAQGVFGGGVMAATLVARAMGGDTKGILTPDKMQIALDRQPLAPEEFVLVMATTLDRLILRLRPFWGSGQGPIRMSALSAGVEGLGRALPGVLRGKPPVWATTDRGFTSQRVHEAAIRLDCAVSFDGEMYPAEPGRMVRMQSSPPLRFVRG
ncbi:MAG: diacylglycerol kinase family protein [Myxococcota bacterium]|nr:diacylglycerol kinase family protein [Myxococcota bacterium]